MSTLVIAEKPSVGKSLAAWLAKKYGYAPRSVGRTHIEVGPYLVSWLFGHVLENAPPDEYDVAYKKWRASDLPIVPERWTLLPKHDAADQIKALKTLLKSVSEVVGLGDPDQEGQLLQDEFLRWAGNKSPVKRLWLAATDDASIEKAWLAMKPNTAYEGYYWAGLARSQADWLFGINGSRACTLASQANGGNATLTLGRVQTPTLALVVARELQIRDFKPTNYFTPIIHLGTSPAFSAKWSPDRKTDLRLDPEGRLLDKAVAQGIVDAAKAAKTAEVSQVKSTKGKELAPLPFSLSSLQEHMSRRFGMGVQDVLKHAQSLYEKKVASYPRTDCEYLPESQHAEAADILAGMRGLPETRGAAAKADLALMSRAFSDKQLKESAHHAIVPRPAATAQITALSSEERLVWLELAKRYLLQFFPAADYLLSEIELVCAGEPYRVSGKVFTLRGWKDAFTVESEDDADDLSPSLPRVSKGDVLTLSKVALSSSTTEPPKRFTEGTLVAAMKAIHKFVTDPKLKTILRENVGIGTEATRANVIGELFNRKFLEVVKKELKPTALGEQLIGALPNQVSAPDMTALWQQNLDDIRKTGEPGYARFMASQEDWLRKMVADVPSWFQDKSLTVAGKKKSTGLEIKPTAHACPKCGGELKHIKGKFGWFFGCQAEACKASFADIAGVPTEKTKAPSAGSVAGVESGSGCPLCKKGTLQLRVCGPASKAPGKQFLSCSNFFSKGKAQCNHSIWP